MERIRDAVRALIMEDDRLLCIKKERPEVGVYYALPGGAHEPNEMLEEMLRRECEEELGTSMADLGLLCVREDVSAIHEYSHIEKAVHGFQIHLRLQASGARGRSRRRVCRRRADRDRMAAGPRCHRNGGA
ncbi:NUDIX domain-containing protein [Paenibacillus thiaminolyticus]|uniref:NUDIX domain-containing protein n=1 Tax=Paenibacillus thiaminolyticus TaxID=49283 RepID=UPI00254335A4|nr:NUDIX domain-containing protein [Paenibacillus thiaminolyticus]WII35314.1 NUDIX domain-containing protein [Paenibacillus thiaminolyticus]